MHDHIDKWPQIGGRVVASGTIDLVPESNVFYYGDNLGVMKDLTPESVDLIYLDPPFNSKQTYSQFFREHDGTPSEAQRRAFEDYWQWGDEAQKSYEAITLPRRRQFVPEKLSSTLEMLKAIMPRSDMLAYLSMMTVRLVEMRRLLTPNGSLYLHCDTTASHYLKLLLDALFGAGNFRNEIIWKRSGSHSGAQGFGPLHDTVLFYAKSDEAVCHPSLTDYAPEYLSKFAKVDEKTGRSFQDVTLTGSGLRHGDSGRAWRGHDPTAKGRHWAIAASVYKQYAEATGEDLKQYSIMERLDRIDAAGLLYLGSQRRARGGLPRYKFFRDDAKGVAAQDLWTDIPPINSQAAERLGYPTQKPVALLERIIRASSNEGDLVLDPFCGCGTTIEAAQRLGRRWIGIDITHVAVSVLKRRMQGNPSTRGVG